jgi:uncharacterized protein (DUF427 family)
MELFAPSKYRTYCEYKGAASYYGTAVGDVTVRDGTWSYPKLAPGYAELSGYLAVYPQGVDVCFVRDACGRRPAAGSPRTSSGRSMAR